MGFKVKSKFKIKQKSTTKMKLAFLLQNLAFVKTQKHIDAIESLEKFYERYGELTEPQDKYLDIIIRNVKTLQRMKGC